MTILARLIDDFDGAGSNLYDESPIKRPRITIDPTSVGDDTYLICTSGIYDLQYRLVLSTVQGRVPLV